MIGRSVALLAAALGGLVAAPASADTGDWTRDEEHVESPEHFGLEARVGVYEPGLGSTFSDTFGADIGPMLQLELDIYPFRIPYIGLIGIGAQLGWSEWDAPALDASGNATGQSTRFEMIPWPVMLVLRVDALARELDVPVVLSGKVGLDIVYWSTGTDGIREADGWAVGLRFAGKLSLELDFLEPRAARQLDEEWGINHSELFMEIYGSTAGDWSGGLPVGGWGWAVGLGFTF